MILPDDITETTIILKDQYMDLKGLAVYSDLAVSTLRDHIRSGKLPCFKVKGKVLVKRSEFDIWMEGHRLNKKGDLNRIVNEAIKSIKMN